MYSIIIPIYKSEPYIRLLIQEFTHLSGEIKRRFGIDSEFIFVVDGSPDQSYERLCELLPAAEFRSQVILHARNFGSFVAIRTGLEAGRGKYFAVISADLQEPPSLLIDFLSVLVTGEHDIAVGVRSSRKDPVASKAMSALFWRVYRKLIMPEMPAGGVDIFGCSRRIRDLLAGMHEAHSSLVGQLYWIGYRRKEIGYARRKRQIGKSSWSFKKKVNYLLDSVFAFTDLPIKILTFVGFFGTIAAIVVGLIVFTLRIVHFIEVPGYTPTVLIVAFFGGLNMLGIGLIGSYTWRAFENTKQRPLSTIQETHVFEAHRRKPVP